MELKIKTERLTLTPLGTEYLDSTCEYALNAENTRLMVFYPKESREEVARFLREAELEWSKPQPDICEFAVLYDGRHIGCVTMYFEGDYTRGELGWLIHRDYWGRGFAAEAARGLMDHFARTMGLTRFIAHCDSENEASKRVMDKLGMCFVETHGRRKNRSSDGERSEELYEMYIRGGSDNE